MLTVVITGITRRVFGRAGRRTVAASTDGRRRPTAPQTGLACRLSARLPEYVPHEGPPVSPAVPMAVPGMALAVHPGGGSPTSSQRVT